MIKISYVFGGTLQVVYNQSQAAVRSRTAEINFIHEGKTEKSLV